MTEILQHPEFGQALRRDIEETNTRMEDFLRRLPASVLPYVVLQTFPASDGGSMQTEIQIADEGWIRA